MVEQSSVMFSGAGGGGGATGRARRRGQATTGPVATALARRIGTRRTASVGALLAQGRIRGRGVGVATRQARAAQRRPRGPRRRR